MTYLRTRLQKLEAHATSQCQLPTGFLRLTQNGDLTPDQEQQIAEAEAAGKFVILRVIVRPGDPSSKLHAAPRFLT
jgi:hypothetical protein